MTRLRPEISKSLVSKMSKTHQQNILGELYFPTAKFIIVIKDTAVVFNVTEDLPL